MQPQNARPWRIVASQAAQEQDSEKLMTLLTELNDALEEEGLVKPDSQSPPEQGE